MKTVNPFLLSGTYIGSAVGIFFNLIGRHPFWWVGPFFGVNMKSVLLLDLLGGAVVGYTFHILFKIFNYKIKKPDK